MTNGGKIDGEKGGCQQFGDMKCAPSPKYLTNLNKTELRTDVFPAHLIKADYC